MKRPQVFAGLSVDSEKSKANEDCVFTAQVCRLIYCIFAKFYSLAVY